MTFGVREARAEEAGAVLELWRAAEAAASTTDDHQGIATFLTHDSGALLVAEADGELVGTLVATWDGWRGNLYRLAVRPDRRSQRVGRALVEEGERRLRDAGARRLSALVMREHPDAVGAWTAAGYEDDARMARFVKTLE